MKIKFQLTNEQFNNIGYNLNGCIQMCNFRFIDGMEIFYHKAFVNYTLAESFLPGWQDTVLQLQKLYFKDFHGDYKNIQSPDALKLQNILQKMLKAYNTTATQKSQKLCSFEVDVSEEELSLLRYYLDLPSRIVLGQWDRLVDFLRTTSYKGDFVDALSISEKTTFIGDCRNDCLALYLSKGLTAGASLGIYSPELSENIRELYDFYKVLMYEMGVKGCYGFPVRKASKTSMPLPSVEFPLEYVGEFDGDITTFEERWDKSKQESLKKFSDEPDKLYLPVDEYTYQVLRHGDKIYKKRNGNYILK